MKIRFLLLILTSFFFSLQAAHATQWFWRATSGNNSSTAANWHNGGCTGTTGTPASTDTVVFTLCSGSSTSCTIDANLTVKMVNVLSNYASTISMNSGVALTMQIGSFRGGTFTGSTGAITCSTSFTLDGTAFTSSSGTFTNIGSFSFKSGTFTANSGTVVFKKGTSSITVITGPTGTSPVNLTTLTFYKVEFKGDSSSNTFDFRDITPTVTNELKISGSNPVFINSQSGTLINVTGNITSANSASTGGGGIYLVINGTGSQSITDSQGAGISGKLPNISINKSNTLYLYGNIGLSGSASWKYTAGTINEGTAKLICFYADSIINNSGGTMKFYDLELQGAASSHTIVNTVTVEHTFTTSQSGNCVINGGTLELQGNVNWNNTASSFWGNATMKFSGTTADTITSASVIPQFYNLTINKTGTAKLSHELKVSNALTLTSGYLITDTTNVLDILNGASTSGASSSSFVRGAVKKIGNSAFIFPVGKDSVYKPIGITAPSNTTDAFRAEYIHSPQALGTSKDSLTYISQCEYWALKRTAGTSNIKVTLYWDTHTCDIYVASTLRIGYWNGSLWHNTGMVITSGTLSSGSEQNNSNQSSFGYFTICKRSPAVYAHAGTDTTFCRGGTKTLGASPTGTGGIGHYTYSWVPTSGLTSSSVAHPAATPAFTTNYILAVIDSDHSFAFDTAKITILQTPFVDAGPDRIVCGNDSIYLGGSPTSADLDGLDTFVWKKGSTYVSSESNPRVGITSSGDYIVTVTNTNNACSAKDTAHLTFDPELSITAGQDTTVIIGYPSITLGGSPTSSGGTTPYSYSWLPSTEVSSATIANPATSYAFSKMYYLTVKDSLGCINTDMVAVTVKPPPLLTVGDYGLLSGNAVTVQHTATVDGKAGAITSISSGVTASDGKYINTSGVQAALVDLDTVINRFNALSAQSINYNLSGKTYGAGVYRIDSFAYLNDTLTLQGDQSSYFIFLIRDSLVIHRGAFIDNNTGDPGRVYFIVNKKMIAHNVANIQGNVLVKDSIKGDTINGPSSLHSKININIKVGDSIHVSGGIIPFPSPVDPVNHIEAWNVNGQTFIKWSNNTTQATKQTKYTIYRYTRQITKDYIDSATAIGYVLDSSGVNVRLESIIKGNSTKICEDVGSFNYNYAIPRANGKVKKLGADTGLFVMTDDPSDAHTAYYYAITDSWNSYPCNCENRGISVAGKLGNGGNSVKNPVTASNTVPRPYLQDSDFCVKPNTKKPAEFNVDIYTQFISNYQILGDYKYQNHNSTSDYYYPPMVNSVGFLPFNFSIYKSALATGTVPLDIILHGDGGDFLTGISDVVDDSPTMISLFPDDWLPVIDPVQDGHKNINPGNFDNTGWGGYNECYDVYTLGLALQRNPISDSIPIPPIGNACEQNVAYSSNRVLYTAKYLFKNTNKFRLLKNGSGAQIYIDTNAVLIEGASGGGIGSFFLALYSPQTFAGVQSSVPKLNLSFAEDEEFAHKWKFCTGKLRNQTDEKLGAFSQSYCGADCNKYKSDVTNLLYLLPENQDTVRTYYATNAAYFAAFSSNSHVSIQQNFNTPIIYAISGRNDSTMGWRDKVDTTSLCVSGLSTKGQDGIYRDIKASTIGGFYFWDTRDHGGDVDSLDGLQLTNWNDRFRYSRKDQSFPAFSGTYNITGESNTIYRGWQALPTSDDGTKYGNVDFYTPCTTPDPTQTIDPTHHYYNGDCLGSVDGFLDWYDEGGYNSAHDLSTQNTAWSLIDDVSKHYKIWVATRDLTYTYQNDNGHPLSLAAPDSCVTNITLRRIHSFATGWYSSVYYELTKVGASMPYACGITSPNLHNPDSTIRISGVIVYRVGTKIELAKTPFTDGCPMRLSTQQDTIVKVVAFPNPFQNETNIRFNLKINSSVDIQVYDLTGKQLKFIDEGNLNKGEHNLKIPFASLPVGPYIAVINLSGKRYPLILMKGQ